MFLPAFLLFSLPILAGDIVGVELNLKGKVQGSGCTLA